MNSTEWHFFNETIRNFGSTTNSNLELVKNNFNLEYPIDNSTPKSFEVGFERVGLELVWKNFGMESMIGDSIVDH
jgi:hypothetical protein